MCEDWSDQLDEPSSPMTTCGRMVPLASRPLISTGRRGAGDRSPWVLGGLDPSREDLTWAVLIAFASGLFSTWAMVMIAFEIGSRSQGDGGPPSDG
jgi:hypothetical protein